MSLDHFAYYAPGAVFKQEVDFLLASLQHLGIVELLRPHDRVVGLGASSKGCMAGKAFLWVGAPPPTEEEEKSENYGHGHGHGDGVSAGADKPPSRGPVHFALAATDREQVDVFHREALKAGGKCNGPPGTRAMYHPGYYAAFVWTPAGINLEVVFHDLGAMAAAKGGSQ